jgi:hypothetical protein
MTSDSATDIATQQSIKAYSDSLVVDAGYTLISETAITGSPTTIDFTGLSDTYKIYALDLAGVSPSSGNVEILFRVSTDNGSSFISSAASYAWSSFKITIADTSSAGDTEINTYSGGMNNASADGMTGRVYIVNPTDPAIETQFLCYGNFRSPPDQAARSLLASGKRLNAEDNNAIRLFTSGATALNNVGTIYLYGVS